MERYITIPFINNDVERENTIREYFKNGYVLTAVTSSELRFELRNVRETKTEDKPQTISLLD